MIRLAKLKQSDNTMHLVSIEYWNFSHFTIGVLHFHNYGKQSDNIQKSKHVHTIARVQGISCTWRYVQHL